jgi:hypothetical protein
MVWAIEKKLGIDVACAIEEPMVCQTPRWRKMDGFELSVSGRYATASRRTL